MQINDLVGRVALAKDLEAEHVPIYLFVHWLATTFDEGGGDYVAFQLGGLTVVAGRGEFAAELEGHLQAIGVTVRGMPAARADDRRGEAALA